MGKRLVIECDLTKQEYDPKETVTITFKKGGKKAGRTYELSASAATKLEQQLVAGAEAKLSENWCFSSEKTKSESSGPVKRTLADLEDDSEFVRERKASLREQGVISEEPREEPKEQIFNVVDTPRVNNGCRHLNKGRTQTTLRNNKRFAYKICSECHEKIPEQTKAERSSYLNARLPVGEDIEIREK